MDAYLFDTNVLSRSLNPNHPLYEETMRSLAELPAENPRFVSVVSVAEFEFGINLVSLLGLGEVNEFKTKLIEATGRSPLGIGPHTASVYAEVKAKVAHKYLPKALRKEGRPKYVEEWKDKVTGQKLGVDENDLWMCAQAKERGLVFVTADKPIQRISDADPGVVLRVIETPTPPRSAILNAEV